MRKLKLNLTENVFQQGDVLLKRIDKLPNNLVKQADGVLQLGEVTGHKHQFLNAPQVEVYIDSKHKDALDHRGFLTRNITPDENKYLVVKGTEPQPLTHEEHKTIMVPPGTYKIDIVYEYDYEREELARVAD